MQFNMFDFQNVIFFTNFEFKLNLIIKILMFTPEDIKTLEEKGVAVNEVEAQIDRFKIGFPFLKIADSAQIGNGIKSLSPEEEDAAIARWQKYLADGGEVCKFVPASGAASRMFKSLFFI